MLKQGHSEFMYFLLQIDMRRRFRGTKGYWWRTCISSLLSHQREYSSLDYIYIN